MQKYLFRNTIYEIRRNEGLIMKINWKIRERYLTNEENYSLRAYGSQAALYVIISLVPCILLLLTLIQYTPATKGDLIEVVVDVFPTTINATIVSIVNEVYSKSTTVIPLTAIVTVWSASRGVLAMTNGLNHVYGQHETRGYIYLRLRSAVYTIIFLGAIVLTLILLVFGNSISLFVNQYAPLITPVIDFLISIRVIIAMCVLTLVFASAYTFLPDAKLSYSKQIIGSVFASICWLTCSLVFSVYLDVFKGFSDMYGSLTTIVLIMLWLDFCMYFMLLGAKINMLIYGDVLILPKLRRNK